MNDALHQVVVPLSDTDKLARIEELIAIGMIEEVEALVTGVRVFELTVLGATIMLA